MKGLSRTAPASLPAVEVDTAARFEHVLLRLGADWAHDHKKATLRWTAQAIMKESAQYRKNALVLKWSQYFRSTTSLPTSKEKGHLELFVVQRIVQLNVVQRRAFFANQFDKMQKRHCVATGQEKCTIQHNTRTKQYGIPFITTNSTHSSISIQHAHPHSSTSTQHVVPTLIHFSTTRTLQYTHPFQHNTYPHTSISVPRVYSAKVYVQYTLYVHYSTIL